MTKTAQSIGASRVSSRHVFTEDYLIIYTDGTYVICLWSDAP